MAITPAPGTASPGVLLDASTGTAVGAIPAGWSARDWSPDGSTLLVVNGPTVGVLKTGASPEVVELGTLPTGPLWSVAWRK